MFPAFILFFIVLYGGFWWFCSWSWKRWVALWLCERNVRRAIRQCPSCDPKELRTRIERIWHPDWEWWCEGDAVGIYWHGICSPENPIHHSPCGWRH